MKGRSEISDAAAVALVRAYKKYELQLAQTDERTQHTDGWQRVRQTWSALTDELNTAFGIFIKTEQWKKKISNIKTNVKSKKGIAKRDGKVNWSLAETEYDKLFARECSVSTNAGSDTARENSASVGPLSARPKSDLDDASAHENQKTFGDILNNCTMGLLNGGVFDNLVNTTALNFNSDGDFLCNLAKMEPTTMASSSTTNLNEAVAVEKRPTRGTKRKMASSHAAANGGAFLGGDAQLALQNDFLQNYLAQHQTHSSSRAQHSQQSQQQQCYNNGGSAANGAQGMFNGGNSCCNDAAPNSGVQQLQLQAAQAQVEAANIQKSASEKFLLTVERLNNSVSKFESFVGRLESFAMMAGSNNNHAGIYSMNSGGGGGMNLSSSQPQFPNPLMNNNLVYQK